MGTGDDQLEAGSDAEGGETDEEQLTSEWHTWLFGFLVVAGILLFAAPRDILPGLLGSLGLLFVALGVIGWVIKWGLARGT